MHYWNDVGTFDLYSATKKYDMARRVHECIGWALASQIINAAHLVVSTQGECSMKLSNLVAMGLAVALFAGITLAEEKTA